MLGPQDASFPFMANLRWRWSMSFADDPGNCPCHCIHWQGNGGGISIALKPIGFSCKESLTCNVRQTNATDVINRLRPQMNRLPVASAFLQPTQDIRIGGRGSNCAVPVHHPGG